MLSRFCSFHALPMSLNQRFMFSLQCIRKRSVVFISWTILSFCMVLVSSRPNFITSLCHISKSIESRALFLYPSKSRWSKFENGNKTALYSQQLLRNNIRMGCRKDQVIPSSMCIRLGYLFLFRYLWWRCLPPSPSSLTLTSSTTGTLKHIPW